MISYRSAWLALAAVSVLSSCFASRGGEHHTPAVKDESSHSYSSSHATRRQAPLAEPEYFEGTTPPEAPALVTEERPSAPSTAHVWVAGQHTRQDGAWVWSSGHYALPPRADLVWVPGHWVAHLRGYVWIDGAWR